jgi:hypothetical protein
MPIADSTSRYRTTDVLVDNTVGAPDQILFYGNREPIRFQDHPDNVLYVVEAGDTLWRIAARHFAGFPEPSNMWWAIAEYQPEPIGDSTLQLLPGSRLILPPPTLVGASLGARPDLVL